MKLPGFSLLEVLATITILGILAVIAGPEYYRLREVSEFQAEGQALLDYTTEVRNAALTNKKCRDNTEAAFWRLAITLPTSADPYPLIYEITCHQDEATFVVETGPVETTRTALESLVFEPAVINAVSQINLTFFSGTAQTRLEYIEAASSLPDRTQKFEMVLSQIGRDRQMTLCLNRVSGFPTFNKFGSSCSTH